jgi:hypothetical protein
VLDRVSKTFAGIAAVTLLAAGTLAYAQQKPPAVKDQGEYDLTQAVTKEKDPAKQLDLLHQWEQKYPDSDFKGMRAIQIAQTESQIAVKGVQPSATPADVDAAQKAAQDLADNLNKYLSEQNKPANVTEDQWKGAQQQIAMQAHTVLATLDMNKKTPEADAAAEKEYKTLMAMNPNDGNATYNLGSLILRERNVARMPEGLYYIARAVQLSGPQALPPANKTAAEAYLKRAYSGYHGDDSGLDDVKKAALASPTMPPDFKIESVTDIQKKQEGDAAAFAAAHPDIAFWRTVRTALTAPDGQTYFDMIKGSEIPPEGQGFMMFNAKVISQPSNKELLVNIDNLAGDATIKFDEPIKGMVESGTAFKFKGVIDSFVKDPFMLTLTITDPKTDIDGLPATLFAPATKPRPRPVKKK